MLRNLKLLNTPLDEWFQCWKPARDFFQHILSHLHMYENVDH